MRTNRAFEAVARRLGLSFNSGQQVQHLPLVEAELAVTIADDWRPLRIPLQRLRWGHRVSVPAVALTFSVVRFRARQRALRLEYIDLTDNPATGLILMGRVASQVIAGLDQAMAPRLIEGPNRFLPSSPAPDGGVPDAVGLSGNIAALPADLTGGAAFAVEPVSTTIKDTRPDGLALPILLLPGEEFWFAANVVNTVLRVAFIWEEYPSQSDVAVTQFARDQGVNT